MCEFFLGHNLILKILVSIALAVILGPLFKLIANAISNFFSSSYETVSITGAAPVGVSCALLGLTIGLLIHGAGGGIAAGLWGLIIGMIAEATSEAYISDTLGPYKPNIIGWIATAVASWLIGISMTWMYDRHIVKFRSVRNIAIKLMIVVIFLSASLYLVSIFIGILQWSEKIRPVARATWLWYDTLIASPFTHSGI